MHDERVSPGITEVAGGKVRVNLTVTGSVDASGVLTEAAPETREDLTFEVERVDADALTVVDGTSAAGGLELDV